LAQAEKAKEVAQGYVQHESDAVTLVDELLARAGTSGACRFIPIRPCLKRSKHLRARWLGQTLTPKCKSSRAESPKRRSIYAAFVTLAINFCPGR
jgi:hypothetical protein